MNGLLTISRLASLLSLLAGRSEIAALNLSFSDSEGVGCDCRCHHDDPSQDSADSKPAANPDRALSAVSKPEEESDFVQPEAFSRQIADDAFAAPKTLLRPSTLKRSDNMGEDKSDNDDDDDDDEALDQTARNAHQFQAQRPFQSKKQPIRVTVAFESLCRFSRYHIVTTFWDMVKLLPNNTAMWSSPADEKMWNPRLVDNLLIELLPFGNVEYDPTSGTPTCQNGPHECFVDRLQACILQHVPGKDAFEYIVCSAYNALQKEKSGTTRNTSLKEFEQLCFNNNNDFHSGGKKSHFNDLVLPCLNSTAPRKLHDEIWERLKKSPHQFVPWVEINDEYKV